MTTPKRFGVGASSPEADDWNSIDWDKVRGNVRRLQMRIAKAIREGRHGKARALQWLLTHAHSARLWAVKRVTENRGAHTPGVDKQVWRSSKQKHYAAQNLKVRGYRPQPLRRLYILKRSGTMRPLGIPTLRDRAMQALYALALVPVAETLADRNSYGFREGRGCADAIGQCFNALAKSYAAQWVLEADIRSCFDRISHAWLLAHVPMDKRILRRWLRAGYMEQQQWYPTAEGTPQGGIISPLLANLTLDGLEAAVRSVVRKRGDQVNLIRYADDFIVTARTRELLEQKIKPALVAFLHPRGLELSEQKTTITHIGDGLIFLGQTLRKLGSKLVITPARKSLKWLLEKIRQCIKKHLGVSPEVLIGKLNPILRGWANYHRHICAKKSFGRVDRYVQASLYRWAKRRHPNKTYGWIRRKYFSAAGCVGDFSARQRLADGGNRLLRLYRVARTKIERHIKVRAEANPYDVAYHEYFEQRKVFAWRVY
jgi:RNA-directed DNA polymerase